MNRTLAALLLSALPSLLAFAQSVRGRLPLESFSAAQGLANDSVTGIVTDSRGYLWFATLDGISRFDGDRFVNYTTDDGIPHRMVWSVAEDRKGSIWVGTAEGVARMTASASRAHRLFAGVAPPDGRVDDTAAVFADRTGKIWMSCGADLCVFQGGRMDADPHFRASGGGMVRAIVESPSGDLFVGSDQGLMQRRPDGSWRRIAVQPHRGADIIHGLSIDPDGRLWIGNGFGLIIAAPDLDGDERPLIERAGKPLVPGMPLRLPKRGEAVAVTIPHPFPIIKCATPYRARDGVVWQPCVNGLLRIGDGRIDLYDAASGLPPVELTAVAEDPAGNLWIGTRGAGAVRLARSGATSYTRAHGLASERIMSVVALEDGSVCATNPQGLSCFQGNEVHHGAFWSRTMKYRGWGWNQTVVRDRDGTWWFATGEGVVHWPRVSRIEELGRVEPLAIYTTRDGLGGDDVFRIWQDSRGTIWASTFAPDKPLSRFDRATRRFVSYGTESGIPLAAPTAFAEDRDGRVWIGFYAGGLVRSDGRGRYEQIGGGVPSGFVRDLTVDSKGGLWIGTVAGVARIANPSAPVERLAVTRYSRANGLASDSGYCIVEMADRRIAIGSQRGLDILDPASGDILHLTTREGLASNEVSVATLDRNGALWLGTVHGLSRLSTIPKPRPARPPQPRFQSIRIDGTSIAVPELGATEISGVRIEYPRHSMAVAFTAPGYDAFRPVRFEYRMAGARGWTDLGSQHAIAFDQLRSGAGTLEVRTAITGGGTSSPARVSFEVAPPVWKRAWFLLLAAATVTAAIVALHRLRVAHLIAIERVRMKVATDLHDDLGSSLSRISILSDAAKRNANGGESASILDEIADSARGLVDALGDTIWSVDPARDDVRSLLMRIRHFSSGLFDSRSIPIDIRVPPDVAGLHLGPQRRREVYLILKEALNNAAKHSEARRIEVVAAADHRQLRITVLDDGKGFVAPASDDREPGGRGLPNMADRARRVNGTLDIASEPGHGTSVSVVFPL